MIGPAVDHERRDGFHARRLCLAESALLGAKMHDLDVEGGRIERRRKALLGATLLAVRGRWEQVDGVAHLIAQDMQDLSDLLGTLRTTSRNFH